MYEFETFDFRFYSKGTPLEDFRFVEQKYRTLKSATQPKFNSITLAGPKKFNGGKDKQPDFEDEKQFIVCNQLKNRICKA